MLNVEATETKAICFALRWALRKGWFSIAMESDAQSIVHMLVDCSTVASVH